MSQTNNIKLVRVDAPTKEQQIVCEHKWNKAYDLMSATVIEICKKCKLTKNTRPMTNEECDKIYGKDE